MKKLSFLLPFLTCVGLLLMSRGTQAQFETPNRSFHNATTFRLDGRHLTVACESCHLNGQFSGTPKTCYDCHWVRRKDDRFETRLGSQCETCHRSTAWSDVRWDHGGQTGERLSADHRTLACQSCHVGGSFRGSASGCISCHERDYAATANPNHASAGFPTNCETCHRASDTTWRSSGGGGFNHNATFQLLGTHATAACATCHKGNVFRGTARDCVGCHLDKYNATRAPNHVAAGFPAACESCHRASDTSWGGAGFNHNAVFQLLGNHATANCATCHKNNVYKGTARDCVGCHLDKYNATRAPNHVAAGFPTACESCHRASDTSWGGAGFNHNAVFQLLGNHATANCATCHKNNVYKGTARDCVGCHLDKSATRAPNHVAAGFPTACESCHRASDTSWGGAGFNHSSVFALVGRHATAQCASCHVNNVYKGTARDCVGCHRDKYTATRAPNHAASGFSTSCESCHRASDSAWTGGSFNHASAFALVGRHASASCASCHGSGVYRGTARTCVGCHQPQYNATRNPNHASVGFNTTCETCHRATDGSWTQGSFNHTRFPLSGRHNVACAQCHTSGNYSTFSCTVCHSRSEMDSEHRGRSGYTYDSRACYSCHPNGRS